MKKILILITITALAVTLFVYLKNDSLNKEIKKPTKDLSPTISKPKIEKKAPIKKESKVIKKQKEEIKLNLDPELTIDRNELYKNEKYDKPISLKEAQKEKKKDLEFDFGVDVDKKKKEIDGFNMNMEKKF